MLTLLEEGVFTIWVRTSKITNDLFSLYKSYVVFFVTWYIKVNKIFSYAEFVFGGLPIYKQW